MQLAALGSLAKTFCELLILAWAIKTILADIDAESDVQVGRKNVHTIRHV